jgi:hypothetical protein
MHNIKIPQAAVDRVLRRRAKLHTFEDLAPERTAHVVVDLQNGFLAPGSRLRCQRLVTSFPMLTGSVRWFALWAGKLF